MPDTDKDLVEIIEAEADELGLPKDPAETLYGQPLEVPPGGLEVAALVTITLLTSISVPVKPFTGIPAHIQNFLESDLHLQPFSFVQSIKELRDGPYYAQFKEPGTDLSYLFAPDPGLMVVITGRPGQAMFSEPRNCAFAVDIYTNEPSIPLGIARHLNSLYKGGIVDYTDWYLVEALFEVLPADCIKTWCRLLDIDVPERYIHIKANPGKCTYCNQRFNDASQIYCASCGMRRR